MPKILKKSQVRIQRSVLNYAFLCLNLGSMCLKVQIIFNSLQVPSED